MLQLLPAAATSAPGGALLAGSAALNSGVAAPLAGVPAGTWEPVAPQLFAMLAGTLSLDLRLHQCAMRFRGSGIARLTTSRCAVVIMSSRTATACACRIQQAYWLWWLVEIRLA